MVVLHTTLSNFYYSDILLLTFNGYSNEFEYTEKGVLRRINPLSCPTCNAKMNHNGSNSYEKMGLGSTRTGRYTCPCCGQNCYEDRTYWNNIKDQLYDKLAGICQIMRVHHVPYRAMAEIFSEIVPITVNKDNLHTLFSDSVDKAVIPPVKVNKIIYYDEQHISVDGISKFRLTLLDDKSNRPIADEIHSQMDRDTIKKFIAIAMNLDPEESIFIVTDHLQIYQGILEEIFGSNLIHQLCLTHLSMLIVKEFPKKSTFEQEYTKYKLLNIFYNRNVELRYLRRMVKKEIAIKQSDEEGYKLWLKKEMKLFRNFVHSLELKRRREKKTLEQRPYKQAKRIFNTLMREKDSFGVNIQNRLDLIEKRWDNLTAFYFVDGAPATNNKLENYYSKTLKKDHKKQFRTDGGIERHLKLHEMKGAGMIDRCKNTLLDKFLMFLPFLNPG